MKTGIDQDTHSFNSTELSWKLNLIKLNFKNVCHGVTATITTVTVIVVIIGATAAFPIQVVFLQVFYFFTFNINANLSTPSQAAKVTKHTQNSQERWRTTKDMANERRPITSLRMTSADSFRQICFPWSGFFHLFSCLLLCLSLNWVQPPQFYSHSPDALVYLFPSLLLGTSTASLLYYAEWALICRNFWTNFRIWFLCYPAAKKRSPATRKSSNTIL